MESCRMHTQQHAGYRPYYPSQCPPQHKPIPAAQSCREQAENSSDRSIYHHVDQMPLAMAYVPWQTFCTTFTLEKALEAGTIFPELCKPFCPNGRRSR